MTPTEQRVLAIVEKLGEGNSYDVAAELWPLWRTQRGRIPAAAEGRAFKFLHQLRLQGRIELNGNQFRAIASASPRLFPSGEEPSCS